jgi:hypothetical protein
MTRRFHRRFRLLTVVLAVLALGTFVETSHAYCRSDFYKYFEALGAADARVSLMERFVFSFLLTNAKPEVLTVCE